MHVQLLAKIDPTAEACGGRPTLIMGCGPLLFGPQEAFLLSQTRKFSSLTSGVGTLSLYSSRAQLLPLALSLECVGENKASVLFHLISTSCPARGPLYLLPQSKSERKRQIY